MPILWLLCVFFIILILNIIGLLPYVYTITRQIIFTLSIALPFWLRFLLFASFMNTSHFLSHLVPLSTPLALSQFITIIETIRQIIRPITLSVRLCANITAGHILMALRRKPIFLINWFSTILLLLLILETAVAFIQRYVFTILLTIYLRETY
jgi:ATP synthase subunit 6